MAITTGKWWFNQHKPPTRYVYVISFCFPSPKSEMMLPGESHDGKRLASGGRGFEGVWIRKRYRWKWPIEYMSIYVKDLWNIWKRSMKYMEKIYSIYHYLCLSICVSFHLSIKHSLCVYIYIYVYVCIHVSVYHFSRSETYLYWMCVVEINLVGITTVVISRPNEFSCHVNPGLIDPVYGRFFIGVVP